MHYVEEWTDKAWCVCENVAYQVLCASVWGVGIFTALF